MKKIMKKMAIVLALGSILVLGVPKKADAFALMGLELFPADMIGATLCLFFLPFCILDESIDGSSSITGQDLIDNGYQPLEIKSIVKSQYTVVDYVKSNGVSEQLTLGQISEIPGVEKEYLQFVQDNM